MSEKEIKDVSKPKATNAAPKKKKQTNNSAMKQKYFDYYDDVKSFARDNGEW